LKPRILAQAGLLGAEILSASEVEAVRVDGQYKTVTLADGSELVCRALVVATGMTVRQLEVEGVPELTGAGVYYGAAVTEASHYRDKSVMVIGGANSAGQGAMLLSQYASKVTMVIRGSTIEQGMSQYLVDQIGDTENIEVLLNSQVTKVSGDSTLEGVSLSNNETGESKDLEASAMFVFIGARPHSDIVSEIVAMNPAGFILTGDDLAENGKIGHGWKDDRDPYVTETNIPGIFAAGDVQANTVKRVASAVGQGAISVSFVHKYLATT
jgi:thioredoxin reductase (NADPH)